MRISVRVQPRSSKNEILWDGTGLKVRLTAAPVDGAANEALIALLADRLDLPKRSLHIVHGASGRQKILEIEGVTLEDVTRRVQQS